MHPLEHFVSISDGTRDADILSKFSSEYGEYLQRLNSSQRLALRAILSYYAFYKVKYASNYSVRDAITDAMPEYTEASIRKVIATLEGISSDATEGLIRFITEQRSYGLALLGKAASHTRQESPHNQKLAVFDRIAARDDRLQQIGLCHQDSLDTLQFRINTDISAVNRELKLVLAEVSRLCFDFSQAGMEPAQGGQK